MALVLQCLVDGVVKSDNIFMSLRDAVSISLTVSIYWQTVSANLGYLFRSHYCAGQEKSREKRRRRRINVQIIFLFQQSFPTLTAKIVWETRMSKRQRPIAHFSAVDKQWSFHQSCLKVSSGGFMWVNSPAKVLTVGLK